MFIPPRLAPCYYDGKSSLYVADSVAHCYPKFMDVRQARKTNLSALMGRYRSDRAFAEAVGIAPAHVSQMKHGRRQLGDEVARRIESALHFPRGWMDHPHDDQAAPAPDVPALPAPAGDPRLAPAKPQTLTELLDDLSARLAQADPAVRDEVMRLVLRYMESPQAGERIAQAIELLLGTDANPRP